MQGRPVGELLDVAVERPLLEQFQVEVGGATEHRLRSGPPGDHREDRDLDAVDQTGRRQGPVQRTPAMTVSGAAAATTRKTIAPGPSTRRRLLDIDLILDTALALIDEHGRLTMTELAARLGTSASAVYHHVSGRAAIIELLRERIAGPLGWPPPESSDWAAEIADWMRGYRRVMAEHPNVIPLLTAQRPPRLPGAGRRRGRGPPQARRRRVRARARALMVGMRHRLRDRATLDGG